MSAGWLLDNSAWARLHQAALPHSRREEIADRLRTGRLHTCLPFMLEAGVSTRNPTAWLETARELTSLPEATIDAVVERRALEAQHQLIDGGLHRAIPIVDLLLAALAERHRLALLHYDHDFERLLEHTDLAFTSEWLADAGTL